jgi:ribosome-binding protein aMBF1 (putative translation factor)
MSSNKKPAALTESQVSAITREMELRGMKKTFLAEKLGIKPSTFTACIQGRKNMFEPKRQIIRDLLGLDMRSLPRAVDTYEDIWK